MPKTNTALLSSRIAEFFPIAPIEGADQFDFVVNPTGVEYLNLAGTRLAGRFKIVKVDARGKEYDLDEDDDISIAAPVLVGVDTAESERRTFVLERIERLRVMP